MNTKEIQNHSNIAAKTINSQNVKFTVSPLNSYFLFRLPNQTANIIIPAVAATAPKTNPTQNGGMYTDYSPSFPI